MELNFGKIEKHKGIKRSKYIPRRKSSVKFGQFDLDLCIFVKTTILGQNWKNKAVYLLNNLQKAQQF